MFGATFNTTPKDDDDDYGDNNKKVNLIVKFNFLFNDTRISNSLLWLYN